MLPEPMISTPSLRRAASACPTLVWPTGPSWLGSDTCTTGISASGYINDSGTQAPWSKGRLASSRAGRPLSASSAAIRAANAGSPGAGYCTANRAGGKPPKSCQVSGAGLLATRRSGLSQCADTSTMAVGRGSSAARRLSAGPLAPGSSASMGEPWEINRLGSMNDVLKVKMRHLHPDH